MTFDPAEESLTSIALGVLFYVVRLLDRRAKRLTPGTVEYLTDQLRVANEGIASLKISSSEQFARMQQSIDHRREECAELRRTQGDLRYRINKLADRLNAESA